MSHARFEDPYLTHEEFGLLIEAVKGQGSVSADILVDGQFSGENFSRFTTLERLVVRGYLTYTGQVRNDRNTSYHYSVQSQT
jgi:hypothetical protein